MNSKNQSPLYDFLNKVNQFVVSSPVPSSFFAEVYPCEQTPPTVYVDENGQFSFYGIKPEVQKRVDLCAHHDLYEKLDLWYKLACHERSPLKNLKAVNPCRLEYCNRPAISYAEGCLHPIMCTHCLLTFLKASGVSEKLKFPVRCHKCPNGNQKVPGFRILLATEKCIGCGENQPEHPFSCGHVLYCGECLAQSPPNCSHCNEGAWVPDPPQVTVTYYKEAEQRKFNSR